MPLRAVDAEMTALRLCRCVYDVEAYPEAGRSAAIAGAKELVGEQVLLVQWNADPLVRDPNCEHPICPSDSDRDWRALRGKLVGILDQIDQSQFCHVCIEVRLEFTSNSGRVKQDRAIGKEFAGATDEVLHEWDDDNLGDLGLCRQSLPGLCACLTDLN